MVSEVEHRGHELILPQARGGGSSGSGHGLIRRIYEADPLSCEGGHEMRFLSFLTDPPVVEMIVRPLEQKGSTGSERGPPGTPADLAS